MERSQLPSATAANLEPLGAHACMVNVSHWLIVDEALAVVADRMLSPSS